MNIINKIQQAKFKYFNFCFLALIISLFLLGCNSRVKTEDIKRKKLEVLTDSIADLIIKGDTLSLKKALILSDSTLEITHGTKLYTDALRAKIMVLSSLGCKKEAFLLQDEVINKDPDSIDRLIYNGVSELNKKDYLKSKVFFEKAINLCDKQLALKPNDSNIFVSKIGIYIFLNDRDKANIEVDSWLALHSEDELVLTLKENLDNMFIQTATMVHEMQKDN